MTVTEVLQLVDQLVFKHTGNHLNNLQKNVVQGIWQGKSYGEIAKEFGYDSENHIGNVSRELYRILSAQLGEDVNKSNFCWTIERLANSYNQSSNLLQQLLLINSPINLCSNNPKDDPKNTESDYSKKYYHDLTLAPKIAHFCDRTLALQNLSHWLTTQNPRLISVLGLSGIGKTTLVKHFVDLNLQQFDLVIWKSIKLSPSLDTIITDIFALINPESIQTDKKLTQLFNLLRQKRCLIILDDVQEIFTTGQFAGQYKTEYKDYKTFFTMVTEIEHQSSLILIGQEQCQEMLCLDEELYPVKCLELEGLDNTEILKNLGLKDEESWLTLLNLYEGNPAYLKDIASLIKNIFLGKVSEFLTEDSLILSENMKSRFNELFERLSASEQQIVLELSNYNQPVSREDLRQALFLSSMDLINGLQSLRKRYLLKPIEGEKTSFNLSPVFREYVRTCRQN
jgi:NB-ARC domain